MKLLSREEFKAQVFARDDYKCVTCGTQAVDAHHLLDRTLFEDGGYYVDNGVALCALCHIDAENSSYLPKILRIAAGIPTTMLPPGFDESLDYDKWGKVVELTPFEWVQKTLGRIGCWDDDLLALDIVAQFMLIVRWKPHPFWVGRKANLLPIFYPFSPTGSRC